MAMKLDTAPQLKIVSRNPRPITFLPSEGFKAKYRNAIRCSQLKGATNGPKTATICCIAEVSLYHFCDRFLIFPELAAEVFQVAFGIH
jgi:hypothetical protein